MTLVSALEESFDIAWSFMEKSGELRAAAEFANIILDSIERKRRWVSGEICLSGLLGSVRKLAW